MYQPLPASAGRGTLPHLSIPQLFIRIVQVGQEEWTQITRHLFCTIDSFFFLNNTNNKYRLDPIYIKKIKEGDASWITTKRLLGWSIDTYKQVLTHP